MHSKPTSPHLSVADAAVLRPALAAVALLMLLVACESTPTPPPARNAFVASVAGYQVVASLDCPATFEPGADHALITFGHHRLRVEKGRVVLDDNETAAFPASASRVDIVVSHGRFRMTADGQEMWSRPIDTR